MSNDMRKVVDRLVGALGLEEAAAWEAFLDKLHVENVAADAAANTATANTHLWSNPTGYPMQIVAAGYNGGGNVASNATDYTVVELYVDDGAGGTPVLAASINTVDGALSNGVDEAFTLTAQNCVIAAGANVYRKVTKGGAGKALPEHALKLRLRPAAT